MSWLTKRIGSSIVSCPCVAAAHARHQTLVRLSTFGRDCVSRAGTVFAHVSNKFEDHKQQRMR